MFVAMEAWLKRIEDQLNREIDRFLDNKVCPRCGQSLKES